MNILSNIIKKNIDNEYIHVVQWSDFKRNPNEYIKIAYSNREKTPSNKIIKSL